jgi:hypothetical protein
MSPLTSKKDKKGDKKEDKKTAAKAAPAPAGKSTGKLTATSAKSKGVLTMKAPVEKPVDDTPSEEPEVRATENMEEAPADEE